MDGQYGTVCPYCSSVIVAGQRVIWCSECGRGHHEICWVRHSGCTTAGCTGVSTRLARAPSIANRIARLFGDPMPCDAAGKTCPYCQQTIVTGDKVLACGRCEIPHHTECWAHNGGCTTYGCVDQVFRTKAASTPGAPPADHLDLSALGGGKRVAPKQGFRYLVAASVTGAAVGLGAGLLTWTAAWIVGGLLIGWFVGALVGEALSGSESSS